MPEIKLEYLLMFTGFILPGAISIYVYRLKVPQKDSQLKEQLLETICFSVLNFALLVWLIQFLLRPGFLTQHPAWAWIIVLMSFVVLPAVWPFLLVSLLHLAESRGLIGVRARTAWDDFFGRERRGFWIQVVLQNDTIVGGRFSTESYASAYPDPGHLYIQELWDVDEDGKFISKVEGGAGILLRPADYKSVRVYLGD
jgi:hypothetical protein